MNSKEKTFIGILAGVTVLCAGGLYLLAGKSGKRIDAAKEEYTNLSDEITKMENLTLFPTAQNLANKEKEVAAYQANAEQLAKQLQAIRPAAITNTDPQTFTNTLVKTAEATMKAYAAAKMTVEGETGALPRGFYLGFENYTSTPAQQGATGILAYELGAISEVHALLAAAKPAKLLNFMRAPLPEEKNETYAPTPGIPYRTLPIEISFSGPEKSMREFINGLQSSKSHFYLIRTMRVKNEKQTGPKSSDVQFEKPSDKPAGGSIFDSIDAFTLPDAAPAPAPAPGPEGAAPAPAPGAAAPAPAPAPGAEAAPAADPAPKAETGRILKQVLGSENVEVFLRIDILLYDAPAAPKP
jgi:gas vesicle protein